jgi:hypothetical protein
LFPELTAIGVILTITGPRDMATACGMLVDQVNGAKLRHRPSSELYRALEGAKKRRLGDAWAWARNPDIDISPLTAATLALWGWEVEKAKPKPRVINLNDLDLPQPSQPDQAGPSSHMGYGGPGNRRTGFGYLDG